MVRVPQKLFSKGVRRQHVLDQCLCTTCIQHSIFKSEFVDFPACIVADCLAKESLNKSEELIIASLIVLIFILISAPIVTSILLVYMCFILDAKIKGKIFKYQKLKILEINSHVYYYNVRNCQSKQSTSLLKCSCAVLRTSLN